MRLAALAIIALLYAAPVSAQVIPSLNEGVLTLPFEHVGATHIMPFEANGHPGKELLFLDLREVPVRVSVGVYEPTFSKWWPANYTGPICMEPFVALQQASEGIWQSILIEDFNGDGLDDIMVYSTGQDGGIQTGRLTVGKGLQYCK